MHHTKYNDNGTTRPTTATTAASNQAVRHTALPTFTQPDTSRYSKAGQPLDIHASPTSVTPSHPFTLSRWSPGQPSPNAFNVVGCPAREDISSGIVAEGYCRVDREVLGIVESATDKHTRQDILGHWRALKEQHTAKKDRHGGEVVCSTFVYHHMEGK